MRLVRNLGIRAFDLLEWFMDDVLDYVFTPFTTPIIGFAATAAYYAWIVLTGYTILTTIPQEHWKAVGAIAVFGWYFGTEWNGWFKRKK